MEHQEMALFLTVCSVMLACAEILTRRTPATLRWVLLAVVWLFVVFLLFWVMGVG